MTLRLNLGAGGQTPVGWVNVDRAWSNQPAPAEAETLTLDLVADRWPWASWTVEGIVLHHVLDLLAQEEMRIVLKRCHGVLEPGGVLRMSCANLSRGVQAAIEGDINWFAERVTAVGFGYDMEATVGGFITQWGARRQSLTLMALGKACERAGFSDFTLSAYQQTHGPEWMTELDSRENESWFCEAVKA